MIDLPKLASHFEEAGIMDRPFRDLSRDDVLAMVRGVLDSLSEKRMPYLASGRHGNRELVVPAGTPRELQTWRAKNSYLAMHALLASLNAEEEVMVAYLGKDWRETVKEQQEGEG